MNKFKLKNVCISRIFINAAWDHILPPNWKTYIKNYYKKKIHFQVKNQNISIQITHVANDRGLSGYVKKFNRRAHTA